MNGTKAKRLRREAEATSNGLPTSYVSKVMKKEIIPTERLDGAGKPVMVDFNGEQVPEFFVRDKITTRLADCTRKVYKKLKRAYPHE